MSKMRLLAFTALLIPVSALRQQCCIDKGVSSTCAHLLCDPEHPPGDMERYTGFDEPIACKKFLPQIAECLSDGRDVTKCCRDDAERKDLGACFGLCRGNAEAAFDSWNKFQTCFVINLTPMYSCFAEAYDNSPSAPYGLKVVSHTSTSAELQWQTPNKNPSLITRYDVIVTETSGKKHAEVVYNSKDTSIFLSDFQENKKYTVYVVARGSDDRYSSHPSDFVQFSTSTFTESRPVFVETVKLPPDAQRATLACHLRQGALNRGGIIWEKKDRGQFKTIEDSNKHQIVAYSEKIDGLNYHVSSLAILNLERSDFAVYKCHLESETNDFGEVRLVAFTFSESEIPQNPPETAFECCSKTPPRPHCTSVCSGISAAKDVKPGAFLPHFLCMEEFNTLMKCTLQGMNSVGCCIRKMVPYHCLGMCDNRFISENIFLSDCIAYVNDAFSCQKERVKHLPYAVSGLKAKTEAEKTSLEWQPSEDAEVYHVYHRNHKGTWLSGATVQTKTVVSNADEVAVIAVNKFGYSGAHRIASIEDRWSSNYVY